MTDQNLENKNSNNQINDQKQVHYQGQPNYGQGGGFPNIPSHEIPQSYLAPNIIATILGFIICSFCCIGGFVGIVGIVFSSQVTSKLNRGDLAGATTDSKTAKTLMIVSFVITALALVYSIISIISVLSSGDLNTVIEQYQDLLEQQGY